MERSEEEEEKIRRLRDYYKKSGDNDSDDPGDDTVDTSRLVTSEKFKLFLRYFAVIGGFFAVIALLIMLFDCLIIPGYVHNKDIVQVPDLTGMKLDKAKELLGKVGLQWDINGEQYDPDTDPGEVLIQIPEPGLNVKEGRPIYLTISKGAEKVKVPYLVGLFSREAMVQLVSRGLAMGKIRYENSEMFETGIVMGQSIRNGRAVMLGDTVNLVVSKGSEFTIRTPDLIGKELSVVRSILAEYGLMEGTITTQEDETFSPGTVLWQYPTAGDETIKGAYVDLIISMAPGGSFFDIFDSGSPQENQTPNPNAPLIQKKERSEEQVKQDLKNWLKNK